MSIRFLRSGLVATAATSLLVACVPPDGCDHHRPASMRQPSADPIASYSPPVPPQPPVYRESVLVAPTPDAPPPPLPPGVVTNTVSVPPAPGTPTSPDQPPPPVETLTTTTITPPPAPPTETVTTTPPLPVPSKGPNGTPVPGGW